jgi:hypothetical protein
MISIKPFSATTTLGRMTTIALCVLFASSPALAQTKPSGSADLGRQLEARKHATAAAAFSKKGLPRDALREYLQAYRLARSASNLRGIAKAYVDLEDFATAHEAYADLLKTTFTPALAGREKQEVLDGLAASERSSGMLRVRVAEPDATVSLGGRDIGVTPLDAVRLNPGTYKVAVTKPGFVTVTKEIILRGGADAIVDDVLAKEITTGHLAVTATGPSKGAKLLVDGKDVGEMPWEGDVDPGKHSLEAQGKEASAAPRDIQVAIRSRTSIVLEIAPDVGHLDVDPHRLDATVGIDGKPVGKGRWEGDLPIGKHTISVERAGFETFHRTVELKKGETVSADAVLTPSGPLEPEQKRYNGAYVRLDGQFQIAAIAPDSFTTQPCPIACSSGALLGGGGAVRVGYNLGYLAFEAIGLGGFDHQTGKLNYPTKLSPSQSTHFGEARNEEYEIGRPSFGGALGLRFVSHGDVVRFTVGAAGGVIHRRPNVDLTVTTLPGATIGQILPLTAQSTSYTAPAALADLALMFGSSAPGVKFVLGGFALLEVAQGTVMTPGVSNTQFAGQPLGLPPLQLARSVGIIVGPSIGLQFGY